MFNQLRCPRPQTLALLACVLLPAAGAADEKDAAERTSVAPVLWQPSMNVFRRFSGDPEALYEFYGEVLGFEQLATLMPGGTGGVARFQAGASELKLTRRVPQRQYQRGGVADATGVRLLSFFFPDEAALAERFRSHGLAPPDFEPVPGGESKTALLQDPDGQWVELVVVPDAPESTYAQIEVGLTVADLERSRAFYRDFVGLTELDPVRDHRFDTIKYPFRHGSTIVSLRSFGSDLPADTGSGGIQYVVSDADHVDALAKAHDVTIDQPLSSLANFSLRTIWLDDPDGITNYFAETSAARSEPQPAAASAR